MKNPYRADDAVMTMVKGKKIEALVIQTWNNEVQVKTVDGDLLWRTMYTVWYPGEEPLVRADQSASAAKPPVVKKAIHKKTAVAPKVPRLPKRRVQRGRK